MQEAIFWSGCSAIHRAGAQKGEGAFGRGSDTGGGPDLVALTRRPYPGGPRVPTWAGSSSWVATGCQAERSEWRARLGSGVGGQEAGLGRGGPKGAVGGRKGGFLGLGSVP